ncbi:MAG: hypothetical protein ACYDD1_14000 [Caulobacteraceae bacterium]
MKIFTLALACASALFLVSCASSGTMVTDAEAGQFISGQTTMAQVISTLGKPTTITHMADGQAILSYSHVAAHASAASYVPVVGLLAGGAKGTATTATFAFDAAGRLESHQSSATDVDYRSGLLNQH